ncbi:MAG: DNA polymerase I [Bacteroidales bacterium]|nr:DNA polymerase I [Bacteroidales bacterium]
MSNKIFFLDAYALIFRAYYAFIKNPRINSKKINTSAIFGFVNTLEDVLKREKPTHIAVAFDPSGPNFRHEMFPEYKANREATPEDIKVAVPYIKQILEAYRIPIIQIAGYEADDVIGTLAKKFANADNQVFMMTPDKDYGQLVDENTFMYRPPHSGNVPEILGVKEVNEKFNIDSPLKVIDILALWGDKVDNIPGVPGIGEKTAASLIEKYGNIENIINNIPQLKGKQQESFRNNIEQLRLSYKLATIKTDVPLDVTLDEMKLEEPDFDALAKVFDELEFFTLKQRIIGSKAYAEPVAEKKQPAKAAQPQLQLDLFSQPVQTEPQETKVFADIKSFTKENVSYTLVETPFEAKQLAEKLATLDEYCFDTETTGTDALTAELVGMAFALEKGVAYYVVCPADKNETTEILKQFLPIFSDKNKTMVGQNLKYDLEILGNYDVEVENKLFDTMLAHYILEPEEKHNLDFLANKYLGYKMIPIEELIGEKGKNQRSMRSVDSHVVCNYSCEDADITLQLKNILLAKIKEQGIEKLLYDIEIPLIKVLMSMERTGVRIDSARMKEYSAELQKELVGIEESIYEHAGEKFNISSPKQLGVILFEKLKVDPKPKMTKTKQYSTSEEELAKLVDKHPIVNEILEWRSINKLISTYVDVLPTLVNQKTGMLHTSFNQAITATGRLSSANPNLQNIPIREERGKVIRSAFVASDDDHIFFSADYSQIELRVMAHLSQDPAMLDAFNKYSLDIHTATAAKIFKVDESEVTREMRSKAKTANFGIIYGISAFGLGQRLQISPKEGKALIDSYFETFHGVKEFIERSIADAREKEYVETMFGRRRYLLDINSRNAIVRGFAERNAVNAPIQGSAADIVKIAMINIFRRFNENNLKAKMILQVHDELNFNVPVPEMEIVKQIVVEEMQNCVKLSVPLIVDARFGKNWLEAH